MKKTTTFLLTSACALTISDASGMLLKQTLRSKKMHSFSTDTKELRLQQVQVVMNRYTIKKENNILKERTTTLMGCIAEQNKVLDQIDEWASKPRTELEFIIEKDQMTALAQRLLELEQYKENLLS
jgi:hypothetical protein